MFSRLVLGLAAGSLLALSATASGDAEVRVKDACDPNSFPPEAQCVGRGNVTFQEFLAKLLDAAKSNGNFIVVLHVGGEERRDVLSNQLIELTAPRANYLIIREDSDADGMFARLMGELVEPRREFIQANALDAAVRKGLGGASR